MNNTYHNKSTNSNSYGLAKKYGTFRQSVYHEVLPVVIILSYDPCL